MPEIGILVPQKLRVPQFLELCLLCEEVGIDTVWLAEDCFTAAGPTMAAMVLERTSRLGVGLGILPAVARNVAFTAMEVATLANAHPGRLTVGIGHGMPHWMRQVGVWPSTPVAALEETISALRRLLAGETVTMSGTHVRLDAVTLEQAPDVVPQVLAGVRGPMSLAASGRVADGTILCEPTAPAYLEWARATIDAGGRDPAEPHRLVAYNWFAPDFPGVDRALRIALGSSLSATQAAQLAPLPFGAEVIELAGAAGDPDGSWLKDEWLDQLSVRGEVGAAARRIRQLAAAGAGTCVLLPLPGVDPSESVRAAGVLSLALRTEQPEAAIATDVPSL